MPESERVPARALAVYGHPDDPEISAGGTLARWAEAGGRAAGVRYAEGFRRLTLPG